MADQWYLSRDGQQFGPYTWQEILAYARDGHIAREDLLWSESTADWVRADQTPAFPALAPEAPISPSLRHKPRWAIWGLGALVVLAIVSGVWLLSRGDGEQSATLASLSLPGKIKLPGEAIPLEVGASLFVPEGVLPSRFEIRSQRAETPLLPEGVEPVGEALEITADAAPSGPVLLRLPIPAGVGDPSQLVVVRTEADGTTTLLMTEARDDHLAAYTPGFSTFSIARFLEGTPVRIVGKSELLPGEKAHYYLLRDVQSSPPGSVHGSSWFASDGAALVHHTDDSATVQAGPDIAVATLTYSCIDVAQGVRWYGAVPISIHPQPSHLASGFLVNLLTTTPIVLPGDSAHVSVTIHGEFEPPIRWNWEYGDGQRGSATTGAGETELALPAKRYALGPDPYYTIRVAAKDASGRTAQDALLIFVLVDRLTVQLEGPQRVMWEPGGVTLAYTAIPGGGEGPYTFDWGLMPGRRSERRVGAIATQTVYLDQPGEHSLALLVTDAKGERVISRLPIQILGGDPLHVNLWGAPDRALPNSPVEFGVQMRDGVLVVGGQKGSYSLQVDWGDGSSPTALSGLGADLRPDQGVVAPISHAWAETGSYTLSVVVHDAAGRMARIARQITIADDAAEELEPEASPTARGLNTAPVAEHQAVATHQDASIDITLHGRDAEDDELTYQVMREPANGRLSGAPPLLTYTPNPGFWGYDSFTFRANDGSANSMQAAVGIEVTRVVVWVLDGPPVVNAGNAPLAFTGGGATPGYFDEPRFAGKSLRHEVSESSMAMHERYVDGGREFFDVALVATFDAPPERLAAGEPLTLTVHMAHSGHVSEGNPGIMFQYTADRAHGHIFWPQTELGYFPWAPGFDGTNTKAWTALVPGDEGGHEVLEIIAFLWNCPACNVTWRYRIE